MPSPALPSARCPAYGSAPAEGQRRPLTRTRAAAEDRVFSALGEDVELVREAAANRPAVGLDGAELHAEPSEDALVGLEHAPVLAVRVRIVHMEGIAVLHDELAAAHQAEARADLIAELRLNLEDVQGQLLVAGDDLPDDVGHDFFVRRAEAEVRVLPILEAEEFLAVQIPAPAFLPELLRLDGRHQQL